jgi:hypothetical protein
MDKTQLPLDFVEFKEIDVRKITQEAIQMGVDHADVVQIIETGEVWSELASNFLESYILSHDEFMAEDVRNASVGMVPEPPDQRAWGGIIQKYSKAGIIYRIGYRPMKSPNCHMNPKAVWRRI